MHRSATSLVARGLDHEISLGETLIAPSASNPRGHYEDVRFVKMNDRLLAAAGGSWHCPPARSALMSVAERFNEPIRALVGRASAGKQFWGFKDPRTTLTVELYLPHLSQPHFICCFRDPEEVARSLRSRNGFSLERGRRLAGVYNQRLLEFLHRFTGVTASANGFAENYYAARRS